MPEEKIIFSVEEVFQDRLGTRKYRIPDYQRGYKWTKDNVTALLNDINNFEQVDDEQFYCLQNITIIPDGDYYNVIDGQQRLTTLYILLSYLGKRDTISGKLDYQIRRYTADFLKEDILKGKCWEEGYKHEVKHQDEAYIMGAAKTIQEWFAPSSRTPDEVETLKSAFSNKLLTHTKLIVNEVYGNEHQTFSNLNGVRVPLDAADLIRAMLITYSVKENRDEANLDPYRARMGAEIDDMDRKWSQPELRRYYIQFLPDKLYRQAKELRFDITGHSINLLYLLFLLTRQESISEISLDSFERYIKQEKNTFDTIKDFHNDLMDWYSDINLYHYVGFLFFNFKDRNVKEFGQITFKNVYKLWEKQHSKLIFLVKIKQLITSLLLADIELSENNKASNEDRKDVLIKRIKFNFETNWYEEPKLPSILILNDIVLSERSNSLNRIPPAFLRINDEDREHISCQTPGDKELNNKQRWSDDIAQLEQFEVPNEKREAFKSNLERLKKKICETDEITVEVKQEIISSLTQFGLNSIGNIVLLNLSVNRGYRNSPFIEKRKAILNNYFNENADSKSNKKHLASKNKFIRPFTLRTFLLNLSDDETKDEKSEWTLEDIQKNANQIAEVVSDFISGGTYNG